jgi:hypothetical protein
MMTCLPLAPQAQRYAHTRRIKYGLWDANHTCGTSSVELSMVLVEPGRGLGACSGALRRAGITYK